MSDCIIRLGGYNCINNDSLQNFSKYLKEQKGRIFIVLSSIPEISELISGNINHIYSKNRDLTISEKKLPYIFKKLTGNEATPVFRELAGNVAQLFEGISMIGDYSPALRDQVLSYGEKLSALILKEQLKKFGLKTKILLPEDYHFIVSADFGNASYLSFNIDKPGKSNSGDLYIIPGSYGITTDGKIARAGKSAADYTAASLAKTLDANKLIIWGLEKDFYNSDPGIVKSPKKIKRLTYSEASELAYFDHYSLHPRTVEPLEPRHIPIRILNTDTFQAETVINTESFISEEIIKAIAYSDDISILKLNGPGVGLKPGILAKVTTCLNEAGINVKSVITSQISINIILSKDDGYNAIKLIRDLGFTSVIETELIDKVTLIGIVGHGMQQNYGVSAKLFSAVAANKINVLLSGSGASDLVSYLVVKKEDRNNSIKKIHEAFFQSKKSL